MRILSVSCALLLAVLTGCSSLSSPGGAPIGIPVPDEQPLRPTLQSEQQRLAEFFRGTPVVFEMQPDGSMRVEVPLQFSFDRGRSAVKPPLAAVLDRLAWSQRETGTRLRVTAAHDRGRKNHALVYDRARSARDYLVSRGIASTRLRAGRAAQGDGVEVIIEEPDPR
ncbi:MAG: hypothetical protein ABIQ60_00015 [Burkholderiaceae bacterium]